MSYSTIEPTVIDEDLIRKAINEQLNPEISEIAKKEGIAPDEVSSLRLDYKNILKIDNFWIYENITKLQLDNNIIEKIENIGFLKNLQWLDLSFNNITEIEGLENLVRLTDLTLFNNRISKIERLDDLVNLQVFSIGNNNIQTLETLSYLIKFEKLRVLNLSGNAVCKNQNYKDYCLAHFKRLKYLDYRLIDPAAVAAAREKFIDSIISLEEEEKIMIQKREEAEKMAELDKLHGKAHILRIHTLFDRMFDDDTEFKKLVPIAPAIVYDMKEEFRAKFEIVVKEMKHFVLKKAADKGEETAAINQCTSQVKKASDAKCKLKLEDFYHLKKELIKIVLNSRNAKEVDEALSALRTATETLSDQLMEAEMVLVEQFEDVLKEYERNYTELCNASVEFGQSSFSRLRELCTEFMEKLTETILGMYDRFNKGDIEEVDEEIRDIMSDKDVLMNAINSSHDFRMGKIDQQEEVLTSGVAQDLESVIRETQKAEIKRNRDRVNEIIAFCEKNYADIDAAEENSY